MTKMTKLGVSQIEWMNEQGKTSFVEMYQVTDEDASYDGFYTTLACDADCKWHFCTDDSEKVFGSEYEAVKAAFDNGYIADGNHLIHDGELVYAERGHISDLRAYLKDTEHDAILVLTSLVSGGWYENESAANEAGFGITRCNKKSFGKFSECYKIIRK